MQWCDAAASKTLRKDAGDDRFTRAETAPHGGRRTIPVWCRGRNGYLFAVIARYCFRAAFEWAGVVLVGAEGPMLTVVVDDDDFRYGVVSDG